MTIQSNMCATSIYFWSAKISLVLKSTIQKIAHPTTINRCQHKADQLGNAS
jgi:hypothetical protein